MLVHTFTIYQMLIKYKNIYNNLTLQFQQKIILLKYIQIVNLVRFEENNESDEYTSDEEIPLISKEQAINHLLNILSSKVMIVNLILVIVSFESIFM